MERVNRILRNPDYVKHIEKIRVLEENRMFCCHNMAHFLDVARIATIFNYEMGLNISREFIYAAALLHDIGRHLQYTDGIPHEEASQPIAAHILIQCGFSEEECKWIVFAIANHRNGMISNEKNLSGILYRADKASRPCFACEAEAQCEWKKDKKNLEIVF